MVHRKYELLVSMCRR